ncbi:NUDIX domain-containing protein [Candidatus Uhrbacteria bacterium]|nr:NUDIX domain-containing protein [Candidatus Uhrbacteria bacterium]
MKVTTLCYPIIDGKVLLAKKKRGFGVGKLNGPGGKVEPGESIEAACRREVFEEVGVACVTIESRGTVEFVFPAKPEWNQICHIFVATQIQGDPIESDEMLPAWYPLDQIPYQEMWEDDPYWLPNVLSGGNVSTKFYFDKDAKLIKPEV